MEQDLEPESGLAALRFIASRYTSRLNEPAANGILRLKHKNKNTFSFTYLQNN